MARSQPRSDAKLAALDAKVEERHRENKQWQVAMDGKVDNITAKIDSLLASRSFSKGIWKAVTVLALLVSAVGTVIAQWLWKS